MTDAPPPPPGYQGLVALDRQKHSQRGIDESRRGPFAAALHGIHVQMAEFIHAARDYPVVFAKESATGRFLPLAITGLKVGENLFVDAAGEWEPTRYVPAYVRRWPFFAVPVRREGETGIGTDSLICVDESVLVADAPALFDAEGKPTEAWTGIETLVRELEAARGQTERLIDTLITHNLLQPFEAHAFPRQGGDMHLTGMFRVDENRLNALEGKIVKGMMKRGELSRIYAHMMSLDNFKFLLDRSAARKAAAETEKTGG